MRSVSNKRLPQAGVMKIKFSFWKMYTMYARLGK